MASSSRLFGTYYIRPTATALVRAWKLCNSHRKEYEKLRRHSLKLAFWPNTSEFDLDWDWIKGLEEKRIGEQRIDELINSNNNVRVIFFKANRTIVGDPRSLAGETMLRIWTLTVFQKKKQGFSAGEIKAFRAMRDLVVMRHYGGAADA